MLYIKIRYLRERDNISRRQLANSLNISYTTLSKYETNERQPDLETIKKIAMYFNVTTDYLLDVPFNDSIINDDLIIHFNLIKSMVRDSKDLYFNNMLLSDISKTFIYDALEFISSQIDNIEGNA